MRSIFFSLIFFSFLSVAQAQTPLSVLDTYSPQVPYGFVDIMVEADTYTPSFYKGRSEPVAGSPIRLAAIAGGYTGTASSLQYRWSVDGKVVYTGINSSIKIDAPDQTKILIEVLVTDTNNRVVGKETKYVPLSKPKIIFYTENILRGLSRIALRDGSIVSNTESLIRAETYFIDRHDLPPILGVDWMINGVGTDSEEDWRKIVVDSGEEGDSFTLSLSVYNKDKLGQAAKASVDLLSGI